MHRQGSLHIIGVYKLQSLSGCPKRFNKPPTYEREKSVGELFVPNGSLSHFAYVNQ